MLRSIFDSVSNLVTFDFLHIPEGTLLARYLKIWIAFFISGSIHAGMAEEKYDIRGSGTVRFFCTQAFGIMLEDGIQEGWRRITGTRDGKHVNRTWHKIIGFLWLLAFLTWSTPVWSYRMFQFERPGIDNPLEFSPISKLTSY